MSFSAEQFMSECVTTMGFKNFKKIKLIASNENEYTYTMWEKEMKYNCSQLDVDQLNNVIFHLEKRKKFV